MKPNTNIKSKSYEAWIKYAALRSAILELLYSTGMRINELVKLTEDNIDLISGTVIVKEKKKERLCPLGKYAEKAIKNSIESRDNILFLSKKRFLQSPLFLINKDKVYLLDQLRE